jgi:hypothetical protein
MSDRDRMAFLERQGEEAYSRLYDASHRLDATARYNDAKEAFHSAIGIAEEIGDNASARRLSARLAEIKAVFRTQFSQ